MTRFAENNHFRLGCLIAVIQALGGLIYSAGAAAQSTEGPPAPSAQDQATEEPEAATTPDTPSDSVPEIAPLTMSGEAANLDENSDELLDLSLDDLLNITVTTATKSERTSDEVPSIVTVFTKNDIDRLGARFLSDLLQYVPGFIEVSAQLDKNFAIRGIHAASAQHFVILIDGVAANDFLTSTASPDAFSLDYIQRVEIIRGPGSAIYGASALMGVINLITKSGKDDNYFRETVHFGTGFYLQNSLSTGLDFDENGSLFVSTTFWGAQGTRVQAEGDEDILLQVANQDVSNGLSDAEVLTRPRSTTPVLINRYGPSFDIFAKYQHEKDWAARINFARTDSYLQRTYLGSLVDSRDEMQPPRYTYHRIMLDVEKHLNLDKGGDLMIRPTVSFHAHQMNSARISSKYFPDVDNAGTVTFPYPQVGEALIGEPSLNPNVNENMVVYGWSGNDLRIIPSIEYSVDLPAFGFFKENNLIIGIQPEYDILFNYKQRRCYLDPSIVEDMGGSYTWNQQSNSTSPYGSDYPVFCREEIFLDEGYVYDQDLRTPTDNDHRHAGNGDEFRIGAFLQYSTFLPKDIGLLFGGRLDYHEEYDVQFSPRVGIVAPISGGLYTKFQYSKAFIYPAYLYRNRNGASHYSVARPTDPNNPAATYNIEDSTIKPQSIDSFEILLGLKRSIFRLELNGYLNIIRDFITYDTSKLAQYRRYAFSNQGDAWITGVEANTLFDLVNGKLTLNLHGSLTKAINSKTDEVFLDGGTLAGSVDSHMYMAGLIVNVAPWKPVNLNVSFLHAGEFKGKDNPETTYTEVAGLDDPSSMYSSKSADEYNTMTFLLNANITFYFFDERFTLGITGYNLLNRVHYRPGATSAPMMLEGLKVIGQAGVKW